MEMKGTTLTALGELEEMQPVLPFERQDPSPDL